MDSKKIFLAIALALFGVISFSKGANAYDSVPQVVRNQLRDSCRKFKMYEVNYDGTQSYFDTYNGRNDVGTANWVSSDIDGEDNVNAVYEKRDFEISEDKRTFFINIAVIPCFNKGISGGAVNVRIDSGRGNAEDFSIYRLEAYGGPGSGYHYEYGSAPGELKRSGQIIVTVKSQAIKKFRDGDYITFWFHQCARANLSGINYPPANDPYEYKEHDPTNPGGCYSRKISIRVKVPNKFNIESSTKAAVLNSSQSISSGDTRFKSNGRSNPQVAKVGQWVSFRHRVTAKDFNRSDVRGFGSYTTFRNSGSGDSPISSNGGFIWQKNSHESQKTLINQGLLTDPVNSVNGNNETFRVTRDMAGKTICSSMAYSIKSLPGDIDNRNRYNQRTNEACVYVPYNFDVTPCVKIDKIKNCSGGDIDVPTDGKIPPDPNNGEEIEVPDNGTGTSPIKYKITTWRVPAAREGLPTVNTKKENKNGNTCATDNFYWQVYQGLENCKVVREDSSGRSYDKSTKVADYIPEIEEGAEAGTRYCVALSISPYKMSDTQSKADQEANNNQWRHSAPICIKVVKKPKVQFWGNGVFSRAGIRTSLSPTKEGVLGSWVEYEAITGGNIRNFRTESSQSTRRLAIENYTSTGNFGQGAPSIDSVISSISSRFPRENLDNTTTRVTVHNNNNTTINGHGLLAADRRTEVIYGNNLHISDNIVNGDRTVNNDSDFRQIIIIADGNITIDSKVTRIDAWLIAKGTINTCAVDGVQNIQKVTTQNCNERLQIRGGTLSNTLKLWRTHGSDGKTASSLSEPAEIIKQSADTYLWGQAQSGGQGKIVTTYTKELPVRY
jgi:hypothetical protein